MRLVSMDSERSVVVFPPTQLSAGVREVNDIWHAEETMGASRYITCSRKKKKHTEPGRQCTHTSRKRALEFFNRYIHTYVKKTDG